MLVKFCNFAAESGNKEFACTLLSPLGKRAEVYMDKQLDRCLTVCKESFEELVVTTAGNSVHSVAAFLSQLKQFTSFICPRAALPYMLCSSKP